VASKRRQGVVANQVSSVLLSSTASGECMAHELKGREGKGTGEDLALIAGPARDEVVVGRGSRGCCRLPPLMSVWRRTGRGGKNR